MNKSQEDYGGSNYDLGDGIPTFTINSNTVTFTTTSGQTHSYTYSTTPKTVVLNVIDDNQVYVFAQTLEASYDNSFIYYIYWYLDDELISTTQGHSVLYFQEATVSKLSGNVYLETWPKSDDYLGSDSFIYDYGVGLSSVDVTCTLMSVTVKATKKTSSTTSVGTIGVFYQNALIASTIQSPGSYRICCAGSIMESDIVIQKRLFRGDLYIHYNGIDIVNQDQSQTTITLPCANQLMATDIVINIEERGG